MTSQARIDANQKNAQLSTGPRTAAGKRRSCMNSLTHGLRSEEVVLPTESRAEFDSHLAAWMDDWRPPTATRRFLVERAAAASWKLRRCMRNEASRQMARAHEAADDWDRSDYRRLQDLARTIARAPDAVAAELLASRAGVDCLIGLEREFLAALRQGGDWRSDGLHDRFVCLLDLATEPDDDNRRRLREASVELLGRTRSSRSSASLAPLTGVEFAAMAAPLVDFCRRTMDRLIARRDEMPEDPPAEGRPEYVELRSLEPQPEDALYHRYEARLDRECRAAIGLLMTLRKTGLDLADDEDGESPAPAPASPLPDQAKPPEPEIEARPEAPSEPKRVPGQGLVAMVKRDPITVRRGVDGPDDVLIGGGVSLIESINLDKLQVLREGPGSRCARRGSRGLAFDPVSILRVAGATGPAANNRPGGANLLHRRPRVEDNGALDVGGRPDVRSAGVGGSSEDAAMLRRNGVLLWIGLAMVAGLGVHRARGAGPAPAVGHWEGTLTAAGSSIRMVFHVTEAGGVLRATFDSPDQASTGIPVDSVAVAGSELTIVVKGLQGQYKGKLNAGGTEAGGTWSQLGRDTPLTLKKTDKPTTLVIPAGLVGVWEGKLKAGPGPEMRLVLRVTKSTNGAMTASFASPDQGANFLPINAIALEGDKVSAGLKSIAASYAGVLNKEKAEIVGTWTQSGRNFPLNLKKTDKVSEPKRSQVIRPPIPYKAEEVAYANKAAGLSLAGTITVPKGDGPFPAALMITGSGPQDRDETLMGHRPFLVIADALTRRGIAVLRVDDRGVGKSTGKQADATSEDFATDVEAGIAYLKTRKDVDPKAIGLIGHSEGGLIAPIVAARSKDVGFIVLMAGTGVDGATILREQSRLILKAEGASDAQVNDQAALMGKIIAVVDAKGFDEATKAARLATIAREAVAAVPEAERKALGEMAGKTAEAQIGQINTPWFRFFLGFDPKPTLAKVRCPVLAINGAKDLQVPARLNLAAIEGALKSGGNAKVTIKEFPGLNHLFQACKTGSPSEYAAIEETVNPAVLTFIADWIVETTGRK